MPRRVDHEQRRRHIAEAVWVIAATRGLEAASLRDVAAQAEVSMGMVQHYFGSKEQMLLYACRHLVERAEEGQRELEASSPEPGSPRSVIRSIALQSLPLDEPQRLGASVWYAFLARSVVDGELAAVIRGAWAGTHAAVAHQLRAALGDDVDADEAADELVALIDGLVSHVLVGDYSNDRAVAAVDAHLVRVLGAE